jgi:DNA replication protein DnaC
MSKVGHNFVDAMRRDISGQWESGTCGRCAKPGSILPGGTDCRDCWIRLRTCRKCSKEYIRTDDPKRYDDHEFCSDTCAIAALSEEQRIAAEEWWQNVCPAIYRATDVARLPRQKQSREVLRWQRGKEPNTGLLAFGPSGAGKTRSMFLLMRRLKEEGLNVRIVRAAEFAREVVERCQPDGIGGLAHYVRELAKVHALFLDDLDKARFTPRVESELFELIEARTSSDRPLFVTTNASQAQLAARLSPETGPAIVRRLCEFCDLIDFDAP